MSALVSGDVSDARVSPRIASLVLGDRVFNSGGVMGSGSSLRVTWTWAHAALHRLFASYSHNPDDSDAESTVDVQFRDVRATETGGSAIIHVHTVSRSSESMYIHLVAFNPNGPSARPLTAVMSASFLIQCILDRVLLRTARGAVRADAVRVGDAFVQPDGTRSQVVRVQAARIFVGSARRDARLFEDSTGRAVVTAFHAVRLGDEGPLVAAWAHPEMAEIVDAELILPATVYHFQLEAPTHVIGVEDTAVWLESLEGA